MNSKSLSSALTGVPSLVALFTGLFAIAVFIIDTVAPIDIAVSVLYVVVVLMAAQYFGRRYALTHEPTIDEAAGRCLMGIAAIGATTFLALKNQSANAVLRDQARLLDLT